MTEYRCPGETCPISRAVHLGRLTHHHAACRQCDHRADAALSTRQVRQMREVARRAAAGRLFHDEGAGGAAIDEFGPAVVRRVAVALGTCLAGEAPENSSRLVVVGGDGRPLTAELVAALADGLRWTGCHVVDVGTVSGPCLAAAIDQTAACGGVLAGNPGPAPHTVGLKFWAAAAVPLSRGRGLDESERLAQMSIDRPTRACGSIRRHQAETAYLAALRPEYHALRPLDVVLQSNCPPAAAYFDELTRPVACRIFHARPGGDRLGQQVVGQGAHFGMLIDDDGEIGRVVDERGRSVAAERLLAALACHCASGGQWPAGTSIVLEAGASEWLVRRIRLLGAGVVRSGSARARMARAMREHAAPLGGGATGRFWFSAEGAALPDALRTLTHLLAILSGSDLPLGEVLDRDAPAE
jgi:phosphomannomutase/phosphoglucomutase